MSLFDEYFQRCDSAETRRKLQEVQRRIHCILDNQKNLPPMFEEEFNKRGLFFPSTEDDILAICIERLKKLRELNLERLGEDTINKMFTPFVFDIESDEFDEHSIILDSESVCYRIVMSGDEYPTSKMIDYPKARILEKYGTPEFPNLVEISRIFTRKSGKEYSKALVKVFEGGVIISRLMDCDILGSSRDSHVAFYKKFAKLVILDTHYGAIQGNSYIILMGEITPLLIKLFGKQEYWRLENQRLAQQTRNQIPTLNNHAG